MDKVRVKTYVNITDLAGAAAFLKEKGIDPPSRYAIAQLAISFLAEQSQRYGIYFTEVEAQHYINHLRRLPDGEEDYNQGV